MEINSWEVIAKLIAQNTSVGFIPDYLALGPERDSQIHPCEVDCGVPYRIYIAHLAGEELSRNAQLFTEVSCETFNALSKSKNSPKTKIKKKRSL